MVVRHGFTLLELLVSVFLTSIVVLAAYALVNVSSNSFQNEIDNRIVEGNLENAAQIIGRDLSRVGYHVPFDARGEDRYRIMGTSVDMSGIRSINYINRVQVANSPTKYVAQLKLVIDMTDHEGFNVIQSTDTEMTLRKETTSYLTLSDVLRMPIQDDHVWSFPQRVMDGTMADSAFERTFRYAKAVYVKSSKKGERVLIMLKNVGGGALVDNSSSPLPADYLTGKIYYSKNEKPAGVTNTLDKYGFDGPGGFIKESVSPIVGVVYRYNNHNLERCYAKSLRNFSAVNSLVNDSVLDACSTIVHNVAYFELYPITDVNQFGEKRGSFVRYLKKGCSGVCAETTDIGSIASFSNMESEDVSKIIGFYYRIGAYGDNKVDGGRTDGVQPPVLASNGSFYPLSHTQGTILVKNRISLSGGSVKCTSNHCNLHFE